MTRKLEDTVSLVREFVALLESSTLGEIEVEGDELRIRVARPAAAAPLNVVSAPAVAAPAREAAGPAPADDRGHADALLSPMVGTSYLAPEPGAAPFVSAGSRVNEGQTLLIIEAMKVMNPIPAPHGGVVRTIFVADGQPVEYGEPLLVIDRDG